MMNDDNSNEPKKSQEQWVEEALKENEQIAGKLPESQSEDVTDELPKPLSEDIPPNTENTKKPKAKKKRFNNIQKVMMIFIMIISVVLVSLYFYVNHKKEVSRDVNPIEELRKSFEASLSNLELKVIAVKENELIPLSEKIVSLKKEVTALKSKNTEMEFLLDNLKKIVAEFSSDEKINQQLLEIASKKGEANEKTIKRLMNQVQQHLKNKPASNKSQPKSKASKIAYPSQINGFALFNVDLWGNESIAVFAKENKIVKVREGEFIEGYYVKVISPNKKQVTLESKGRISIVSVK